MTDRDLTTVIGSMMQGLTQEVRENSSAVAALSEQFRGLSASVDKLTSIVHAGNGHSLVTKVAVIEEKLEDIDESVIDIVDRKISEFDAKEETEAKVNVAVKRESKYQKYQFYGAVVPAILALIASVLALVHG